jgi:predicted NAD/FAD-dependent oxidoreductase
LIGLIADQTTLVNNFHFMQDIFPKGKQAILSVTVVKNHKYTREELQNKIREELKQHCSIEVGACIKMHKIPYALPKLTNLTSSAKTSQHLLGAHVFQAGDYLANASLNAAMASGAQAAQAIHEFLIK